MMLMSHETMPWLQVPTDQNLWAVFNEKVAWRQYDAEQSEFLVDSGWRKNYPTAKQNAAVLEKQFEAEEELGAMVRMDLQEAQSRYGDRLRLASLGAIYKSQTTAFASFTTVPMVLE
jgi:hypothetical protein